MHKTIYDVAREAGVSIATVSRALNNNGYVSDKARVKIEAAMEGYYPNAAARQITTKQSNAIGVVSALSPKNFFMRGILSESLAGIIDYVNENGYSVLLDIGSVDSNCITLYKQKRIDGIIFISQTRDTELWKEIMDNDTPIGFLGDAINENDKCLRVYIDNKRGAFDAIDYLIKLGHRKIAMLNGPRNFPPSTNRLAGYKLALKSAGVAFDDALVKPCEGTFEEDGYKAALELLEMRPRPTAVFTYNDDMAAGVYKAAGEKGVSIPEDLSVVGFDDGKIASLLSPPLTTIRQSSFYKGRLIAEKVLDLIKPKKGGANNPPKSEMLDCKLIVRRSCCPPR